MTSATADPRLWSFHQIYGVLICAGMARHPGRVMSKLPIELQEILWLIRPSRFIPLIAFCCAVTWVVTATNASGLVVTIAIGVVFGAMTATFLGGAYIDAKDPRRPCRANPHGSQQD